MPRRSLVSEQSSKVLLADARMRSVRLEDCLRDEPQWRGPLRVEEVELSGASLSAN
jgi:hypothetical protein